MSPSIHTVCSTLLLVLDLIQKLMIIKWSRFSPHCVVVVTALESLDPWWSRFTHSPLVNGECLVLLLLCLLCAVYLVMDHRHLPMGHYIWLPSLMIQNRLFWCSIWGTRSSTKFYYWNFHGRWCGFMFLYMEILLLGFKKGYGVVSSIYGWWRSMVLPRRGHNLHINIWNSDWPNNVQLALGGMVRLYCETIEEGLSCGIRIAKRLRILKLMDFVVLLWVLMLRLVLLDKATNSVFIYWLKMENR